jgi:hypothetical protein
MTDEQLQRLIEHKVQEATAPLERRWESLRENIHKMILSSGWQESSAYRSVLATMNELEKVYEPRRKLPTDPRRKVKK